MAGAVGVKEDNGILYAQIAKTHAEQELKRFRVIDDSKYESDFDRMVKLIPGKNSEDKI